MEKGFNPIGEDGAGIVFNTQDDQGVRIWLHAQGHPSNFGCVKFKPMFKEVSIKKVFEIGACHV